MPQQQPEDRASQRQQQQRLMPDYPFTGCGKVTTDFERLSLMYDNPLKVNFFIMD
jgi:hypothetical protein